MFKITDEDYDEAVADNQGFCSNCEAVVSENVEPDSYSIECPECGEEKMMGVEHALIMGEIEIYDEDEIEDRPDIISLSDED